MASQSLIFFFILLCFSPLIISATGDDFGRRLNPKLLGLKKEKIPEEWKIHKVMTLFEIHKVMTLFELGEAPDLKKISQIFHTLLQCQNLTNILFHTTRLLLSFLTRLGLLSITNVGLLIQLPSLYIINIFLGHLVISILLAHIMIHINWHDVVSGKNPSSVIVINSTENSLPFFGRIQMIDNPLTLRPELSSKLVGKAQGLYAPASQTEPAVLMAMNLEFTEGKYNGSTITVLGRNAIPEKVRELPVVGGSGNFRFARGYVEARTYETSNTGDATVEYNVYVLHY